MARAAPTVVGIQPIGVVRIGVGLGLPGSGSDTVLGGRALHHTAVGKRANLWGVLLGYSIPAIIELIDVVLAWIDVLVDRVVGRSLLAGDNRQLLVGVAARIRLRLLASSRHRRALVRRLARALGRAARHGAEAENEAQRQYRQCSLRRHAPLLSSSRSLDPSLSPRVCHTAGHAGPSADIMSSY